MQSIASPRILTCVLYAPAARIPFLALALLSLEKLSADGESYQVWLLCLSLFADVNFVILVLVLRRSEDIWSATVRRRFAIGLMFSLAVFCAYVGIGVRVHQLTDDNDANVHLFFWDSLAFVTFYLLSLPYFALPFLGWRKSSLIQHDSPVL
jgi:hypothetical protein